MDVVCPNCGTPTLIVTTGAMKVFALTFSTGTPGEVHSLWDDEEKALAQAELLNADEVVGRWEVIPWTISTEVKGKEGTWPQG